MGAIGFLIGILVVGVLVWFLVNHRNGASGKSKVRAHQVADESQQTSDQIEKQQHIDQAQIAARQFPDGHWETEYTNTHRVTGKVGHNKLWLWPGDRIEAYYPLSQIKYTVYADGRQSSTNELTGKTIDVTGKIDTSYNKLAKYFPDGVA